MSPLYKTCKGCGLEKPVEEFSLDASKSDGHHTRCKECKKIANAISLQKQLDKREAEKLQVERDEVRDTLEAQANRAALIALVDNHHGEFKTLVQRERHKLTVQAAKPHWQEGNTDTPDWITLTRKETSKSA